MQSQYHDHDAAFRDSLPTDYMRDLFSVWCSWRGDRVLPGKDSLDPLEITHALPYLSLIRVERDPLRFHVRLVGGEIVEGTGANHSGKYMDAIDGAEGGINRLMELQENPRPVLDIGIPMGWSPRDYKSCSALNLPFVDDEGCLAQVLICLSFDDTKTRL